MSASTRRIEDSTPFHAGTDWIMAVLAIGAAVAVVWWFQLPLEFDFNSPLFNPASLLPVLLVGYGLLQAAKAVRARAVGRRFGASVFEMEGYSLSLGQSLRGRVLTARNLVAPGGFLLRLRCIEHVHFSDDAGGVKNRRKDVIHWEAERTVAAPASATDGVPVEFAIPRSAMKDAGQDPIRWTLEVEATVDSEPYKALFGVPVMASDEKRDGKR